MESALRCISMAEANSSDSPYTLNVNTSWLTRPLFSIAVPQWARRALQTATAIALCGVIVSPGLVMLGWHAIYGNSMQMRGKKVPVPFGWIADIGPDLGVHMMRLPFTAFQIRSGESSMFMSQASWPRGESKEQFYESWEKANWNLSDNQEIVSGPFRSGTGASETICMQSSYLREPNRTSASCLLLQGKWEAQFWGDKSDLQTFFTVVRGVE